MVLGSHNNKNDNTYNINIIQTEKTLKLYIFSINKILEYNYILNNST